MNDDKLGILQLNTADWPGGAERISWNLFHEYRRLGHASWLAVGRKRMRDRDIFLIRNDSSGGAWRRFWWRSHHRLQPLYGSVPGGRMACRLAHRLAEPESRIDDRQGMEDHRYPGSHHVLDLPPRQPDIVHAHNLHGRYFDLAALPHLSRKAPLVLTLHDAWLLAGHCAHSFDCDRCGTGCGSCPDLSIYPAVRRDATDLNWQRKRDIFARCRLFVATPSQWLMQKVEQSMLAPAIVERRVIPNGVDRSLFRSGDRAEARRLVSLPRDGAILLFAAFGVQRNPWKDFRTMQEAVERVTSRLPDRRLTFVALGEAGESKRMGRTEIRFVPACRAQTEVSRYYQAADIYVHAARADTFPNSIIEALACGTPVVATAVGGIPEQIRSLADAPGGIAGDSFDAGSATGILTPPADGSAMAAAIEHLLTNDGLRGTLGNNAARDAESRFDLHRHAANYLSWYREILANPQSESQAHASEDSREVLSILQNRSARAGLAHHPQPHQPAELCPAAGT